MKWDKMRGLGGGGVIMLKKKKNSLSVLPPTSSFLPTEQQPRNTACQMLQHSGQKVTSVAQTMGERLEDKKKYFFSLMTTFSSLTVYWRILPLLPLVT